jgi:uncharacterized protein (DUF2235 family)
MPKNIVVFSDGTGQEGGEGSPTNVYKLFNMIVDRSPEQIGFYDRGLGTEWRRKLLGKATGLGISQNIKECYRFIFDNYSVDDKLYMFGFSRGATTVRSLSGFIDLFGILPKSRPELIDQAYKLYRTEDKGARKDAARAFVDKHHTIYCTIEFLGCWDTVPALGVPFQSLDVVIDRIPRFRHSFHNLTLSRSVDNAYHALAIDDERQTFHPKLWRRKGRPDQQMKQVWFCGMHTDVGGGYREPQLSDLALDWMAKMAIAHGLKIYSGHKIKSDPDPDGTMHDSRGGTLSRFYRRKTRSWDPQLGRPTIHQSVLERTKNPQNTSSPSYQPWILQQFPTDEHDIEPY